jgi:hypothetical protein
MTVAELLRLLGRDAPWAKAAEWDPVGLQLGDPEARVERVGVCHEATPAVVAAVERESVDLLVSYHPLLFRATTRLVAGATPEGRALRLVRAGAALAVVHTNFDRSRSRRFSRRRVRTPSSRRSSPPGRRRSGTTPTARTGPKGSAPSSRPRERARSSASGPR